MAQRPLEEEGATCVNTTSIVESGWFTESDNSAIIRAYDTALIESGMLPQRKQPHYKQNLSGKVSDVVR